MRCHISPELFAHARVSVPHPQPPPKGVFTLAETCDQVNVDLDAYKAGNEGCSLKRPGILGHACENMVSLAIKGNYDIAEFCPHEKTTTYWKEAA